MQPFIYCVKVSSPAGCGHLPTAGLTFIHKAAGTESILQKWDRFNRITVRHLEKNHQIRLEKEEFSC